MFKMLLLGVTLCASLTWTACSHIGQKGDTKRIVANISNIADLNEPWAFDGGPDPKSPMGKELIDIVASQPNMPGISDFILGSQKFRPAFGPTLWRFVQNPNSIKILFIGQDGTHIAEAAGRTATAGFGGRAQDMAEHFGVNTGAAFMNTYAFTIRKQYAVVSTPVISTVNGKDKVDFLSVTDNGTWLMSQDQNSPMVLWRNRVIDWVIRNNRESLKMIVLFGGSARDSIGSFIVSAGGTVGSRFSEKQLAEKKVRVPVFRSEGAGSNKIFPVLQTKSGQDLDYSELLGKKPNFETPEGQTEITKAITAKLSEILPELKIVETGAGFSGVAHPAQIGGYDLDKIWVNKEAANDKPTISLKGLKLSDQTIIDQDIVVVDFPHPTALSMMKPTSLAEQLVDKKMEPLKKFAKENPKWEIDPDEGLKNKFPGSYKYARADIAPAYYDFGTPKNRMVSVSSASRMTGKPNVVVIGSREKASFDLKRISEAERATPPSGSIGKDEMFNARPRSLAKIKPENIELRYVFDRGPSEKLAQIMTGKINIKDVADAIKTGADEVGVFGHYRGVFAKPVIIVMADPVGADDILTSRALTGTRGQYLHGFMEDLGVGDQYLVIKTVPFGMDGASEANWQKVLAETAEYRRQVLAEVMAKIEGQPVLMMTDGRYAAQELPKAISGEKIEIINIERKNQDLEDNSGIDKAAEKIAQSRSWKAFSQAPVKANLKMANLPRSHLGFFSRVWEGTSGTRVFTAKGVDQGLVFAIVVPSWAANQKNVMQSEDEQKAVAKLRSIMTGQKLPQNGEGISGGRGIKIPDLNGLVATEDNSYVLDKGETSDGGTAEGQREISEFLIRSENSEVIE